MAIVKANAYGHGLIPAANVFLQAGASWLGVARAEEAMELRKAGIQAPILVLGFVPPAQAAALIAAEVSLAVYEPTLANDYLATARKLQNKARLHIKVDTGMNRLGMQPHAVPGLIDIIKNHDHALLEGIFTHFAASDEADPSYTQQQLGKFEEALKLANPRSVVVHAANSAAAIAHPASHFDLVRIGIALYGARPSTDVTLPSEVKPALEWHAQVSYVKRIAAGERVSYGGIFTARQPTTVATVAVGYGDGFKRTPHHSACVLIHGQKAPVIGRVCMDQIMVDVSNIGAVNIGDDVTIVGKQGVLVQTLDDLADYWDTNNYEISTSLAARLPRLYT